MGIVWLARDQVLERQVAVKRAGVDDAQAAKRLRSEARNAGRLQHPQIVAVFDFIDEGAACWIVMEYVPSRSLAQIVALRGPIPPEEAGAIGCQIADALAHSHAEGVIHGDVTPENILVTGDGVAKLTDFGISRALWTDVTHSRTGGLPGKPRYLPPEVARGGPVDRKSDMFSLGATLFAAVEGRSPYGEAEHLMTYVGRAAGGHVEPPHQAGLLTGPLTALLEVEPRNRPAATQIRKVLLDVTPPPAHVVAARVGDALVRGPSPIRLLPALRLPRRGLLIPAMAALTAAVLAAGVMVLGSWGLSPDGDADAKGAAAPLATGRPGTLGAVPTADPCALVDDQVLSRFGDTRLITDYGAFARCDVFLVDKDGTRIADVYANFAGHPAEPDSSVRTTKKGSVSVTEAPRSADECDRSIRLADGHQIWISAERLESGAPDVCALADTATGYAVDVLNRGQVPRRPSRPAPDSLIRVDACALLDMAALNQAVPTVDARHPDRDFGGWSCLWSSTGDAGVRLVFDRNGPLDSENGRSVTLGNRQSFVEPKGEGDNTCLVQTVHRRYTNANGDPTWELLRLTVYGEQSADKLCDSAEALAAAAAGRLPAP
jgi:hypothetical protein